MTPQLEAQYGLMLRAVAAKENRAARPFWGRAPSGVTPGDDAQSIIVGVMKDGVARSTREIADATCATQQTTSNRVRRMVRNKSLVLDSKRHVPHADGKVAFYRLGNCS